MSRSTSSSELHADAKIQTLQMNAGRCPKCGRWPTWFNDVPLKAYCWGPEDKEHKEWSRRLTGKAQPYK